MKIKAALIVLLTTLSLGLFAVPAAALSSFNPFCTTDSSGNCTSGPCAQGSPGANSPACQQNAAQNGKTTNPVVDTIRTASTILALVGGIAAIIVIIISGLMFVTAGGTPGGQRSSDPNKVKNARSALTGALIGLLIIALGWTIITFVTDKFIG